ncbi:hypothetical protein POJ06DRAFT_59046 [Lipomyces tetrasporus]|uniref:Carboxymethylenebutenolidase n=1 Tax=Lipomyces tetrasporus TaxID=54092 RepID=A0AAD7QXS8_9ASCO|nr:uncharacterized protein POJ06DRAFT_59046 [Lipomyces tetrasporus]KAJ8102921.1 hypothetical protein POJ06DRAFT_59046 [Lipomyces tetrasporus]
MEVLDVPLPSAPVSQLADNAVIQPPLSRRGHGPGLIIIISEAQCDIPCKDTLEPHPLQKWAEEGFAAVRVSFHPKMPSLTSWNIGLALNQGISALKSLPECDDKDRFAVLIYGSKSDFEISFADDLRNEMASNHDILTYVAYDDWEINSKPGQLHLAGRSTSSNSGNLTRYVYPESASAGFILPGHDDFNPSSASLAHTRTLTHLKKHLHGPYFDLEAIWDEHTYFEFETRSVPSTMGTMVQEPYVNHIPTLTGGIGRSKLAQFYKDHFVFSNPDDTALELVSRTVGIDRVIDEFIFSFTHTKMIDWLIPGIPPTGKHLRIPFTAIVNIRGDRLYHEHISWDQATVLVQLGLMPEYLPFPYPLPTGKLPSPGKRFEYRVPAAGVETAMKLADESSMPSNLMLEFQIREVNE